jgi:TonB family protein
MINENKYKKHGVIGTVIFHALLLVALLFLALRTPLPLPGEEGVEVSLGYDVTGSGLTQPEKLQPIQQVQPEITKPEPKEIITQDVEEAPALEEDVPEETVKEEAVEEEVVEEEVKEEPKVNPDALYKPMEKDENESGNQGDGAEQADQGKESGSNESKKEDGVAGEGDGVSFDLEGRGSIHLPKPAYNSMEQGKVVVKIWVNKQGKVVRVQSGVKGTTITDSQLRKMAEDAAKKSVFTPDPNATEFQIGTITYNFIRRN